MSEAIVEMRHITKRFPGIIANDDVSFSIGRGEIFAILGENGAGKSTLMSILFGMYEPDGGEILIRGIPEKISSPARAVELDIGMVHQHFTLVREYTVTENIILGDEPWKRFLGLLPYVDVKGSEAKVSELSARYGLDVDPGRLIEDMDVAGQQRVEILKMLYRDAEILIFDEPTAMLTPAETGMLLKIIENLRDNGKTVILISHKLREIKRVADRCAILNRGKLIDILDVPGTDTARMAHMMVGRDVPIDGRSTEARAPAADFGDTVLSVDGLAVYGADGTMAVNDVSFTVRRGEIFAIAGVSGNGQTEIADAVAGLAEVQSGRISLNGDDISRSSVRARIGKGIAYIPEDRQNVGLILDFPLGDNLALKKYRTPPFAGGAMLNRDAFDAYAGRLIDEYDIRGAGCGRAAVRGMSGGNQQKAIIAREIELGADLIIFVQPTRGLDIGAMEQVRCMMSAERGKGKAILLISYDLDEILMCADTVAVIYGGEFLRVSPVESISVDEIGRYMMGVTEG